MPRPADGAACLAAEQGGTQAARRGQRWGRPGVPAAVGATMSVSMGQFLQPRMFLAPMIMLYVRMWDLEDEEVVFNIRCLYCASQSLVFGALLYIR